MKLLITGATGFVGRNLVLHALKNENYTKLILPVRSKEKLERLFAIDKVEDSRVEIIESSAPGWSNLEGIQVDEAIHCAGVIFAQSWEDYYSTNTVGTVNLIEKLDPSVPVLVLSSLAAAGPCENNETAKDEASSERPVTWYGRSKLEMEKQTSERFSERDILFLRPPMILGARDSATLPLFKMVHGPIQFKPGFKQKSYSYISVNDLTHGIFACLQRAEMWNSLPQRHFFVNSEDTISDDELIRTAAEASKRPSRIVKVPQPVIRIASKVIDSVPKWRTSIPNLTVDRAKEIWPDRWVANAEAFQSSFDWSPKESFREVVQQTHDWFVKSGQIPAPSR